MVLRSSPCPSRNSGNRLFHWNFNFILDFPCNFVPEQILRSDLNCDLVDIFVGSFQRNIRFGVVLETIRILKIHKFLTSFVTPSAIHFMCKSWYGNSFVVTLSEDYQLEIYQKCTSLKCKHFLLKLKKKIYKSTRTHFALKSTEISRFVQLLLIEIMGNRSAFVTWVELKLKMPEGTLLSTNWSRSK